MGAILPASPGKRIQQGSNYAHAVSRKENTSLQRRRLVLHTLSNWDVPDKEWEKLRESA